MTFAPHLALDCLGNHLRLATVDANADIKRHGIRVAATEIDHRHRVLALGCVLLPNDVLHRLFAILHAVHIQLALACGLLVLEPDLFLQAAQWA